MPIAEKAARADYVIDTSDRHRWRRDRRGRCARRSADRRLTRHARRLSRPPRQRVLEQHRDRQRADAAGHRRQRAGDLGDVGMHVADDRRCPSCRTSPRRGLPAPNSSTHLSRDRQRIDADVDHRRAGLDEVRRHERRPADRRDQDVGLAATAAGPASSNDRSSPSRRAAAAAAPSACRRCRCGRSRRRAGRRSAILSRSSSSMTPDGVQGASTPGPAPAGRRSRDESSRRPCAGSMASKTCCSAALPSAVRQRRLHQDAVARRRRRSARATSASTSSPRRRRRQPMDRDVRPASRPALLLVADVDLRRRDRRRRGRCASAGGRPARARNAATSGISSARMAAAVATPSSRRSTGIKCSVHERARRLEHRARCLRT